MTAQSHDFEGNYYAPITSITNKQLLLKTETSAADVWKKATII